MSSDERKDPQEWKGDEMLPPPPENDGKPPKVFPNSPIPPIHSPLQHPPPTFDKPERDSSSMGKV